MWDDPLTPPLHARSTLQLEFKYLSHLTGNSVYWDKVEKVMDVIRNQPSKDGLVPIFMRCVPDLSLSRAHSPSRD